MPAFFLSVFRFFRLLMSGHQAVAIENAALRLQLAAYQRQHKRPVLTFLDRLFWVALRRWWSGWRGPLFYLQADTVTRWHRERFRRFWARLSKPHSRRRGRPATAVEIRRLIEQMAVANPLWRAPRIHGELQMLGIAISERTVSRILRRLTRPPGQSWKTFLHNHLGQIVSVDFFTVPTITIKVLFVFLVLEHRRRQVLHFNCHRASHLGLDGAADRRGVRRARWGPLSHPRSGQYIWQRRSVANPVVRHQRSPDVTSEPMAEPVCGTANRFDPKRVPKPLRYPKRTSFEEDTVCVLPVLPRVENALEPGQTVSVSSAGVKHGQHHLKFRN